MEVNATQWVEKLFYKKIMLYSDLLHCLKEERASLIRIDLDRLWQISKEKEDLCAQIDAVRQEIAAAAFPGEDSGVYDFNRLIARTPRNLRDRFQKLHLRLINLKTEIEILRKENVAHINDSLEFLDEMISIITGQDRSETLYNEKRHLRRSKPHYYLSREV